MQAQSVLFHSNGFINHVSIPSDLEKAMHIIFAYMGLKVQTNNLVHKIEIDNDDMSKTWICFLPSEHNGINEMATHFLQMCGHEQTCYSNMAIFDTVDGKIKSGFESNMFQILCNVINASHKQKIRNVWNKTCNISCVSEMPAVPLCFGNFPETTSSDLTEFDDLDIQMERQTFDTWSNLLLD